MQDPVAGLVQLMQFSGESALVGNIAEKWPALYLISTGWWLDLQLPFHQKADCQLTTQQLTFRRRSSAVKLSGRLVFCSEMSLDGQGRAKERGQPVV